MPVSMQGFVVLQGTVLFPQLAGGFRGKPLILSLFLLMLYLSHQGGVMGEVELGQERGKQPGSKPKLQVFMKLEYKGHLFEKKKKLIKTFKSLVNKRNRL